CEIKWGSDYENIIRSGWAKVNCQRNEHNRRWQRPHIEILWEEAKELHKTGVNGLLTKIAESGGL
ncbi:hypothetical protein BHE74_00040805, partial [Ensete ventricosum]